MKRLFYSYAPADARRRDRLEAHLSSLEQEGLLRGWHDRCVLPGQQRQEEIDRHLEEADLILLLLSPDFLASDSCFTKECSRALQRYQEGTAWVIPVLVRPVVWEETPIARLQALPRDGRPVSEWRSEDRAWEDVARGIRRAIAELSAGGRGAGQRPLELAEDQAGALVYLSSELFGFTKPWRVSLDQPAGVVLDRIVQGLRLPAGFNHEGRIGMSFEYQLGCGDRVLSRAQTLDVQGVGQRSSLELLVRVRPFAAVPPVEETDGLGLYRNADEPSQADAAAGRAMLENLLARAGW